MRCRLRETPVAARTRGRTFLPLAVVAGLLCGAFSVAAAADSDTELQRQGEAQDFGLRGLMPILNGTYSNVSGDYDYHCTRYGSHDNDDEDSSEGRSSSKTVIIGVGIGVGLLLVTVCLTWKACVECCTSSNRRSRHRAFIERSYVLLRV
ncbi:hypothetical protein PHYSODRAFT_473613 [Phytophthora sojae]|uniref:Uncharacterized protein n=1 Tax=Phytophthora sojae (strain P6497) TaxID=1094619 RepID=G4YKC1_PHYSP|nr:hypothetical protein PHYSODRAFT_473613 [Phytophthora sojae]EGZ28205.1 hypothetical protein PHYSODRAFT_473613 [Phytophthora sojae]|eukprot:XP_009515480.1 hypothetical protein PHYSODRAFT_473613 [Phytophthora sojae]